MANIYCEGVSLVDTKAKKNNPLMASVMASTKDLGKTFLKFKIQILIW